jgi:hypothetical protein
MTALLVTPIDVVSTGNGLKIANLPICQSSWFRRIEVRSFVAAFVRTDTTGDIVWQFGGHRR